MAIVLGPNQYGKAEVRVVAVDRSGPRHELRDLTVSTVLRGDFAAAYLKGDNAHVLTTDDQKNMVFAFARDGVGEIEDFGLRLARHLTGAYPWMTAARVEVAEHPWDRVDPHAFVRSGSGEVRTAVVTVDSGREYVLSGLSDLVLLKTTGSGFAGFPRDRFTTLAETDDRILATAVTARWRHADPAARAPHAEVRAALVETFAGLDSKALQQTLYAMGEAALARHPGIAEIRLSLPNRHHYLQDLSPFGLDNPKVVYYAGDRPYGLIEGTVTREGAPEAGPAWDGTPGFC